MEKKCYKLLVDYDILEERFPHIEWRTAQLNAAISNVFHSWKWASWENEVISVDIGDENSLDSISKKLYYYGIEIFEISSEYLFIKNVIEPGIKKLIDESFSFDFDEISSRLSEFLCEIKKNF